LVYLGAREYTAKNPGLFVFAIILTFVLIIAMACFESVRRKAPMNFIFLALFTVSQLQMSKVAEWKKFNSFVSL